MSEFKKTRSALGYFWPKDQAENIWPGQLYIDGFPKAKIIHLDRQFGYAEGVTPRRTIFGRLEGNEHASLIGASAVPTTTTINAGGTAHTWTVTGNYLLVSSYKHYDETSRVQRLAFSSVAAERVLNLKANPLYRDMPKRRDSMGAPAVYQKQVGSYFDPVKQIRVRIFQPRVPSTSPHPLSFFLIDFREGISPQGAMAHLFNFRRLLTVICGCAIDLTDVMMHFKEETRLTAADVYFYDSVSTPESDGFLPHTPLLVISRNRDLFRRVMASYLNEPESRRMARGAFASVVEDGSSMKLSHLRELVTIIEMQAEQEGMTPLDGKLASKLRDALKDAARAFAESIKSTVQGDWLKTIEGRINNINSYDAKRKLAKFIASLPVGLVKVSETFCSQVIELRNSLVHDISKLTTSHYNKLAYFVVKLQAIYAVYDACALGAKANEIATPSRFLQRAERMSDDI